MLKQLKLRYGRSRKKLPGRRVLIEYFSKINDKLTINSLLNTTNNNLDLEKKKKKKLLLLKAIRNTKKETYTYVVIQFLRIL